MVYESLSTIASGGLENGFGGIRRKWIGVIAEEVSEVECVGNGFRDCDWPGFVLDKVSVIEGKRAIFLSFLWSYR